MQEFLSCVVLFRRNEWNKWISAIYFLFVRCVCWFGLVHDLNVSRLSNRLTMWIFFRCYSLYSTIYSWLPTIGRCNANLNACGSCVCFSFCFTFFVCFSSFHLVYVLSACCVLRAIVCKQPYSLTFVNQLISVSFSYCYFIWYVVDMAGSCGGQQILVYIYSLAILPLP